MHRSRTGSREEAKELFIRKEEVLDAHKEHGTFLKAQVDKATENPALKEAYAKMLDDCILLQAHTAREIVVALNEDFNQRSGLKLLISKNKASYRQIFAQAAGIQLQRREAQFPLRSRETQKLQGTLDAWVKINDAFDNLPKDSLKSMRESAIAWNTAVK